MKCADCGKSVLPKDAWYEKIGFARPKSMRGAESGSSLVDRRDTGRLICGECAMDRIHGTNRDQTGLSL